MRISSVLRQVFFFVPKHNLKRNVPEPAENQNIAMASKLVTTFYLLKEGNNIYWTCMKWMLKQDVHRHSQDQVSIKPCNEMKK